MIKDIWKDYFTFSKKERNAVFILVAILTATIAVPYFVPQKKLTITIDEDLQRQLDKYLAENPVNNEFRKSANDSVPATARSYELFQFDPNTLDEDGFRKLGLNEKIIHTLINYRNKGGYFKTPEDIRKIYGLSKPEADRLIPFIHIRSTADKKPEYRQEKASDPNINQTRESFKKININTATAEEWKALPGIGDVLSARIVKFRNMLGGFKSIDDVRKTYGLTDSTFQKIKSYLVLTDSVP